MIYLSRPVVKALSLFVLFLALGSRGDLNDQGISVKINTDVNSVYVHAQLIVTLELKTALPLRNGSLSKLEIKDAVVETLIEDDQREIYENGVSVKLFKRSYAVFPTKAGKLTIPSVVFEGVVSRESNGGFFPGFFSNGKRVGAQSNALSVIIKDVPASYPKGQPFLPLKSLKIADAFDEPDPKFEVNKASTRRFEINAVGNLASSIPSIAPPRVNGLQIYAEAGEKLQNGTEDGITANVSLAHVYLPVTPGPVRIPEQKIYWWDTHSDSLKTTVIKALDIVVEGAAGAPSNAVPVAPEAKEENKEPITTREPESPAAKSEPSSSPLWIILALLFLALWLVTLAVLLIIWRQNRRALTQKLSELGESRFKMLGRKVKDDCDSQNGKQALNALGAFYRAALEEGITKNTAQDLSSCLSDLEKALYPSANKEHVKEALQKTKKTIDPLLSPKSSKTLQSLYPG